MSQLIGSFIAYKLIKQLSTPWENWKAYKLGLIDKNGKTIKKAKSKKEKEAMDYSIRLVKNVKKLIEKLPFGKTRLGTIASALFLLKEDLTVVDNDDFEIEIMKFINISNSLLKESSGEITILSGKYINIFTNDMYYLKENTKPDTIYLNVPLFKVVDLKTRKYTIVSEDDIRKI